MREVTVFAIVILLSFSTSHVAGRNGCDEKESACTQSEYNEFIKCIENQRTKRQTCVNAPANVAPVQGCIAPYCDYSLQSSCTTSCSANCNGYSCQDRCRNACQSQTAPTVQILPVQTFENQAPSAPIVIQVTPAPSVIQPASSPNITTVIRLTNIVNNTNIINVPTTINNTNINNLNITTNSSAHTFGDKEPCCQVVQPKVCKRMDKEESDAVYRCVHRKHHTCGIQCLSQRMHAQVRQPCQGGPEECPPTVSYVPQPNPNCIHSPAWPYVTCGYQGNPKCEGCYDHYGFGFENYHGANPPDCTGCFDDGYSQGPLYRQGPMYRPGYYHAPPCYLSNSCHPVHVDCGMVGCFGHELMDPSFGVPSYSPYGAPSYPFYHQPQWPQGLAPVPGDPGFVVYVENPVKKNDSETDSKKDKDNSPDPNAIIPVVNETEFHNVDVPAMLMYDPYYEQYLQDQPGFYEIIPEYQWSDLNETVLFGKKK